MHFNGSTPANFQSFDGIVWVGDWNRDTCASPCICNNVACYEPASGNPIAYPDDPFISFYPHCTAPNQCFIALYLNSYGSVLIH